MKRMVLIATVAGLLGQVGNVLADGPREAVPISLKVIEDRVTIDNSLDHNQLRNLMQCERPVLAGQYLGLSRAAVNLGFSYQVNIRRAPRGLEGAVTAVDVTLHLMDRMVRIASELPPDSCAYETTLAHERQHVAIDEAVIGDFRDRLKSAVQIALADMGTVAGDTQDDINTVIRIKLGAVMDKQVKALQDMRQNRNSRLDSPQEYRRLTRACEGEALRRVYANPADDGDGWFKPEACPGTDAPGKTSPAPPLPAPHRRSAP